jgi:replicative DNA helicase
MTHSDSFGSFSKYGKIFQEKIFQGLLTDKTWAMQMTEVMTPEFFELKYLRFLSDRYFQYFTKYKDFPTLNLLITIVKEDLSQGTDTILRDQIVEFLHRMKSNPDISDLQYVKEKSLDFCKRQTFKGALTKAVELIETEQFDGVVNIMKEAVAAGLPASIGHDFFNDIEARFTRQRRFTISTGINQLDRKDVLNGGLGKGELGVVVAPTGVGKSHYLVSMGASALKMGYNVVHYTFELSETVVGTRYDSNLCRISATDVPDSRDLVVDEYSRMKDLGRLIIKEYPTGSASITTLRNHIEKMMLKGIKPDIMIIDYADIMRSSRKYDSMRHELKLIYEEVRGLAVDIQVPIWTASQANRDAANSDVVGLENMSEAYGKAMVADFICAISRKPSEKLLGGARLHVAKNRAGRDGFVFPIKIDTSQSRIEVMDEIAEMTLEDINQSDSSSMKDLLRRKWKEVQESKETV